MEKICTDVGDTKGKKHVDCDGIVEQVEKEKDKVENGEKVEKEKERQSGAIPLGCIATDGTQEREPGRWFVSTHSAVLCRCSGTRCRVKIEEIHLPA